MLADDGLARARSRVVAALVAKFGAEHLERVEDAVQDALVAGLETWKHSGAPTDLAAWLFRAANNRAIDLFRRDQRRAELDEQAETATASETIDSIVTDSELRLLLLCCHPTLAPAARVALALSIAGGLTAPQIAAALMMSESALRQVLVRAKRRLREEHVNLSIPDERDLDARLDAALTAIYLMFNEGYSAYDADQLVRPELCREAMRMCGLLLDSPLAARPQVFALASLLFFQGARLGGRTDDEGNVLRLADQDRSKWDRGMLAVAFELLTRAAAGDVVTTYHLEAEIASYHARASSMESTDWGAIVAAYDALVALNPSPVIRLNRAVAVAQARGAAAGLAELDALEGVESLQSYPFFHTARGDLLARAGRSAESRQAFERALAIATSRPVHRFVAAMLTADPVSKIDDVERLQSS
jgi:RNA polymerase sigma-70 factor, ECF subfamily